MPSIRTSSFSEPSCSTAFVAIGHLSLLGEFKCLPCHPVIPASEEKRAGSKQARAECKQPAPCGVSGLLQTEDSQRSGDVPYVMPGDQVWAVPDQQVDDAHAHRDGDSEPERPSQDGLRSLCL